MRGGIMPNTKSAWKNLRKSEKRRLRNKAIKSTTKTYIKKFLKLLETGKIDEARTFLSEVCKRVDMAVSKGVFHRNKAARIKSRLTQKLNRAMASQAA
jgi:small subunit ribosomal protein S20